jgi:hypothetical protein
MLTAPHLDDLRASGLTDETIKAAALFTEADPMKVGVLLNWKGPAKKLGPCLVFTFVGLDGKPTGYANVKATNPLPDKKDKAKRRFYLNPKDKPIQAYFPALAREAAATDRSLVITEGAKKALCACQHGFPTIALVGVDCWGRTENGIRELLPELKAVNWKGRKVFVCYDSDRGSKPDVRRAEGQLAGALIEEGADVRVVELPPGPNGTKCGLDDYFVAGHTAEEFQALLDAASPPEKPEPTRPKARAGKELILTGVDEHRVNDQAVAALANDAEMFSRGGFLVRVVDDPAEDLGDVQMPAGPRIVTTTRPTLRERLTLVADWFRKAGGKEGEEKFAAIAPPEACVSAVIDRGRWEGVRKLIAVVDFPILLRSGEIVTTPGYHAKSGLYYSPVVPVALSVPDRPTTDAVRRAVAALDEVVADFPFAQPHHKAAWMAALFSPLARFTYKGCSPLFLAEANVPAAGKGLLIDALGIVIRGDGFAVSTYPRDDEELRKRVTTILIRGALLSLFDNASGEFGGPSLDALLTAPTWTDRILGESRDVTVSMLATWYATGNNLELVGDTARRVCPIRLDSPYERPEERTDLRHKELREWVRAERPRLLSAALTILRAYLQCWMPDQKLPNWGSYEAWSRIVRGAVVWAGWPDPAAGRVELRNRGDTETTAMGVLLSKWERLAPNGEERTAAQVVAEIDRLNEAQVVFGQEVDPDRPKDAAVLAEALSTLANVRKESRPHRLGCKFRKFQKRIIGGRYIDQAGLSAGTLRWVVEDAGAPRRTESSPPSTPADLFDEASPGGDGAFGGDATAYAGEKFGTQEDGTAGPYPPGVPTSPPEPPSPPETDLKEFDWERDPREVIR